MDEKKIETMMNRFDDMFLQHVSWMSEEKKKEIHQKIFHLRKIRQEKEELMKKRDQVQLRINRMTNAYEQEVKQILLLLGSNLEAMNSIPMSEVEKMKDSFDDDSFALDIDRGDPIFIDEEK